MNEQTAAELAAELLQVGREAADLHARVGAILADPDNGDPIEEMDALDVLVTRARGARQQLLTAGEPVPGLAADVLGAIGPPHDPTEPCEMFCGGQPIGPDGFQGGDMKACCPDCDLTMGFLTHEVLPAIQRQGYWAPPDATPDEEFAAVLADQGKRERLQGALAGLLGEDAARLLMDSPNRPPIG